MTDDPTTTPVAPDEQTVTQQFMRALHAAHNAHSPAWHRLRAWHPGAINLDVFLLTAAGDDDTWPVLAVAGAAIRQHGTINSGRYSLGVTLRRAGRTNHRTIDAITALVRADTLIDIHTAMQITAAVLRAADYTPNWYSVVDDLIDWANPRTRDAVRTRWARDFHTFTPYTTEKENQK